MSQNIDQVGRQRNFLLALVLLMTLSCCGLSMVLLQRTDRVILVPGLNQEAWVSNKGVSNSYLEEAASMYLPMLLDLESGSIDWKKEHLMSHVSQSDPKYMQELVRYFDSTKEKYNQFSLSTHFAVKKFEINQENLTVKAHGQLISRFGDRGFENVPAVYGLGFDWIGGKLLLREFVRIMEEEKQ